MIAHKFRRSGDALELLYAPAFANYFEVLQVNAALAIARESGADWQMLFEASRFEVFYFEQFYGRGAARGRYNARLFKQAWSRRVPTWGTHNGFQDLFVPIVGERPLGHIVCGPFSERRLDARTIETMYRRLSGRVARPDDAEFLSYVRTAVETVVLDEKLRAGLERFGACYANLLAGKSDGRVIAEFEDLSARVLVDYPHERMWLAASGFVDRGTNRLWSSPFARSAALRDLGQSEPPTDVIAFGQAREASGFDPVQEIVNSRALQCECVRLACSLKGALSGRQGESVCLLLTTRAKLGPQQRRRELSEIVERFRSVALRRLGLKLCAGISSRAAATTELPAKYDEALVALQSALRSNAPRAFYEESEIGSAHASSTGPRSLARIKEAFTKGTAATLAVAIDSFQREIIARGHGSIEATKAYLDLAISELLDLIERRSSLDARTVADLRSELATELAQHMATQDLANWFARASSRLFAMAEDPAGASQRERLERARGFIERNYREPLTLPRVAREAGFHPAYFSTLFKQHFNIGFDHYLTQRRLEAARELLGTTRQSVRSVALESGFSSYAHLARAFKRATHVTPKGYRRAATNDALRSPASMAAEIERLHGRG